MGSSFMDEIFQCLSAKTDDLAILGGTSSSGFTEPQPTPTTNTAVPVKTRPDTSPSPPPPTLSIRENSLVSIPKPSRSREVTPSEPTLSRDEEITDYAPPEKDLSLDQLNG